MPEYEYPKISRTEFERALMIFLTRLQEEQDWSTAQKNNYYNYVMDRVDTEGIHAGLPFYSEIIAPRAQRAWQREYEKALTDWGTEVEKATQEQWGNKFAYARWQADQSLAERKFQWQQQEAQRGWEQQRREGQLGERQWQQEQQLSRQNLLAQQWGAQAQRWGAQAGRPREDTDEKSQIWQAAQREILGGLTGEQNWVKRFQAQQVQNPYAAPSSNIEQAQEFYDETKVEYTRRKAAANIMRKRMKDPQDPLSQAAPEKEPSPEQWFAQQVLRAERTAEDKFLEAEESLEGETYSWGAPVSEGFPTGGGGTQYGFESAVTRPWHPETPEWLSGMYPERGEKEMWGTRRGGKPAMLGVPSGQAWGKLSPTQQAGWYGYAQYTGAKPQDLLAQMQKMLPRQPQIAQRWQAARQRA